MSDDEQVTDNLRRPSQAQAHSQPSPRTDNRGHRRARENGNQRGLWLRLAVVVGVVLVLAVAVVVFVNLTDSTPPICTALADGKGALLGTREAYGAAGSNENGARILRQAAVTVRQSCPEYAEEASQMDGLAGLLDIDKTLGPEN